MFGFDLKVDKVLDFYLFIKLTFCSLRVLIFIKQLEHSSKCGLLCFTEDNMKMRVD